MSKHTAGPWEVTIDNDYVSITSDNGVVCDMADGESNWEANAALIAAAPDLLEACKLVESSFGDEDSRGVFLRKAINKAEGR